MLGLEKLNCFADCKAVNLSGVVASLAVVGGLLYSCSGLGMEAPQAWIYSVLVFKPLILVLVLRKRSCLHLLKLTYNPNYVHVADHNAC